MSGPFTPLCRTGPWLPNGSALILKVERHKSRPRIPQLIRYLLVGGFNTAFGYGLFALLNWGLSRTMPYGYLAATLLSNLIAITVAFLGYKWFVFRTKGNYVRQWLRCL